MPRRRKHHHKNKHNQQAQVVNDLPLIEGKAVVYYWQYCAIPTNPSKDEVILALIEENIEFIEVYGKSTLKSLQVDWSMFAALITHGKIESIRLLLNNLDVQHILQKEAVSCFKGAILHAPKNKKSQLIDLLIEQGCDVNKLGKDKRSSIHYAAMFGNLEIFQKLHQAGADINAVDQNGQDAIDYAVLYGRKNILGHVRDLGGSRIVRLSKSRKIRTFVLERPLEVDKKKSQLAEGYLDKLLHIYKWVTKFDLNSRNWLLACRKTLESKLIIDTQYSESDNELLIAIYMVTSIDINDFQKSCQQVLQLIGSSNLKAIAKKKLSAKLLLELGTAFLFDDVEQAITYNEIYLKEYADVSEVGTVSACFNLATIYLPLNPNKLIGLYNQYHNTMHMLHGQTKCSKALECLNSVLCALIRIGDLRTVQVVAGKMFGVGSQAYLEIITGASYAKIPMLLEHGHDIGTMLYINDMLGHLEKGLFEKYMTQQLEEFGIFASSYKFQKMLQALMHVNRWQEAIDFFEATVSERPGIEKSVSLQVIYIHLRLNSGSAQYDDVVSMIDEVVLKYGKYGTGYNKVFSQLYIAAGSCLQTFVDTPPNVLHKALRLDPSNKMAALIQSLQMIKGLVLCIKAELDPVGQDKGPTEVSVVVVAHDRVEEQVIEIIEEDNEANRNTGEPVVEENLLNTDVKLELEECLRDIGVTDVTDIEAALTSGDFWEELKHRHYSELKTQLIGSLSSVKIERKTSWYVDKKAYVYEDKGSQIFKIGNKQNTFAMIDPALSTKLDQSMLDAFKRVLNKYVFRREGSNGIKALNSILTLKIDGDTRLYTDTIYRNSYGMDLIIFTDKGTHKDIARINNPAYTIIIEIVNESSTSVVSAKDEEKVGGSSEQGVTRAAIVDGLSSLGGLVSNRIKSLYDLNSRRSVCIIEPLSLEESPLQDELSQTGLEVIYSGRQAHAVDGSCVYHCLELLSWVKHKARSGIAVMENHAVAYVGMSGAEVRRVAYDFAMKEVPYSLSDGTLRGFTITTTDPSYSSNDYDLSGLFNGLYRFVDDLSHAIFPIKDYSEAQKFFDDHGIGIAVIDDQALSRAYHKLALRLHPDKGGSAEEFAKLKALSEGCDRRDYRKWQSPLQSVKLLSKAIGCTIDLETDIANYIKHQTQENLVKVGGTAIICMGYYTGNPIIMYGAAISNMVNSFYKGEYAAMVSEVVGAAMLTIVPPLLYAHAPRLAFILDVLHTGSVIDTTLDKVHSRTVGVVGEETTALNTTVPIATF